MEAAHIAKSMRISEEEEQRHHLKFGCRPPSSLNLLRSALIASDVAVTERLLPQVLSMRALADWTLLPLLTSGCCVFQMLLRLQNICFTLLLPPAPRSLDVQSLAAFPPAMPHSHSFHSTIRSRVFGASRSQTLPRSLHCWLTGSPSAVALATSARHSGCCRPNPATLNVATEPADVVVDHSEPILRPLPPTLIHCFQGTP